MYNFVQLYNLFTDMMTHLDPRKQQSPENGIHVVSNGLYSTIIMSISKITDKFRCRGKVVTSLIEQRHFGYLTGRKVMNYHSFVRVHSPERSVDLDRL